MLADWERMRQDPLPPSMPHTFRRRLWFCLWFWFWHWLWRVFWRVFWHMFWHMFWRVFWRVFCLWLMGRLRGHLYFLYYLLLYSYTTCSESPGGGMGMRGLTEAGEMGGKDVSK